MTPHILFEYAENNNPLGHRRCDLLSNTVDFDVFVHPRAFDLKGDLLAFYLEKQSKTRDIWLYNSGTNPQKTNIQVFWQGITLTNNSTKRSSGLDKFFPWHNYDIARSLAGNLSFLLRLQQKTTNSYVIQYMSGQLDHPSNSERYIYRERQDSIRDQIRSNNYYGYAVLREFCENPEREMPTLEKIGTSFSARTVNSKSLLYLEPYPDSYDIDTLLHSEIFKVYEMGYDDYYLAEVIKPVESPVAGPDGYAMILDRTETVYGYVLKQEVKESSQAEITSQEIKALSGKSKSGIINDSDGYVNIRREMNAQSEIRGTIGKNEIFSYRELPESDWWYVQTKDDIHGFVHRSRIKEKIDTGGWIIDVDD
jgi:hypothetical protein